jgi:hypothetical protein
MQCYTCYLDSVLPTVKLFAAQQAVRQPLCTLTLTGSQELYVSAKKEIGLAFENSLTYVLGSVLSYQHLELFHSLALAVESPPSATQALISLHV